MKVTFTKVIRFKILSNAFYLVPLVLALYFHLWPTALLCFLVAAFGVRYHLHNESRRFLLLDSLSAWSLIGTNLVLCYLGDFRAPYFWIAFLFVLLAFLYSFYLERRGHYGLNHGLWHLYGALITLFCILTYAL